MEKEKAQIKAITTILFDLDGTLLPMDQNIFVKDYFTRLTTTLAPHGADPKEFIDILWKCIRSMIANDGSRFNNEVFLEKFTELYGDKAATLLLPLENFYAEEFPKVQAVCGFTPEAAKTVRKLKEAGYRVILATSPIFPAIATKQRIKWAGLEPEDFELITTYENSVHGKPNPEYYKDILSSFNLTPEECLMVGNDVGDDMVAATLGINVFLLTDCLINNGNADISVYPQGSFAELEKFIGI